jgi:nucleoside-specific outer membrane channel protein Tsx
MKTLTLIALSAAALVSLPASASQWSDTYLGYRHGDKFQETGCNQDIVKDIISLTHTSGYQYGLNFFNLDVLRSASGVDTSTDNFATSANSKVYDNINGTTDGTGAQELYLVYFHVLSFGKVTKSNLAFGPVSDIGLETGFDFNSKNTAFAPKTTKLYAGPQLSFDVTNGYFNLAFMYIKEHNNNSDINSYYDPVHYQVYLTGRSVDFNGTYRIAAAGSKTFAMGPVESTFKGWVNYTGPKGKDGFGNFTVAETQGELSWMFDLGKLWGHKGAVYIGPGFAYWNNKFGDRNIDNPSLSPFVQNRRTTCFEWEAEIHF